VYPSWKAPAKGFIRYSTVGLEIAGCILFVLFGGQWLDKKLGFAPALTAAGFAFGLAAAIRTLTRTLRAMNREADFLERQARDERDAYHDDQHPKP
jgi:hypothetical protein